MRWFINKMIDNPAILISAYAALISTIALVWNIINSILEKMKTINVQAQFNTTMVVNDYREVVQGPALLEISIVNETNRIKYIKVPQIKLDYNHGWILLEGKKKDNIVNLFLSGSKINYPLEIKPESEITLKYPFSSESKWIYEKSKKNSKFNVIITDTIGKKYKSKRIKISNLKNCIDYNSTINPKLISEIIINS